MLKVPLHRQTYVCKHRFNDVEEPYNDVKSWLF